MDTVTFSSQCMMKKQTAPKMKGCVDVKSLDGIALSTKII